MKRIVPDTSDGWWRLVLLPFKAYVVTAFVAAGFVGAKSSDGLDYWMAKSLAADHAGIAANLANGYFVCVVALLIAAVVMKRDGVEKKVVRSALIYAGIGLLLMGFLWPPTSIPPVK